jgi:hypothetical protein
VVVLTAAVIAAPFTLVRDFMETDRKRLLFMRPTKASSVTTKSGVRRYIPFRFATRS